MVRHLLERVASGLEWGATGLNFTTIRKRPLQPPQSEFLNCKWPLNEPTPHLKITPQEYTPWIKEFAIKNHLVNQPILFSFPRSELYLKLTDDSLFPLPQEKFTCATYQSAENSFSIGIPKERLRSYVEALTKAGLKVKAVGLDFVSKTKALTNGIECRSDALILLDIGATQTQITFIREYKPLYCRSFAIGGNDLTNRFQKVLGTSWKEAEKFKLTGPLEDPAIHKEVEEWTDVIIQEFLKTQRFVADKIPGPTPQRIYFIGGGSKLSLWRKMIHDQFNKSMNETDDYQADFYGSTGLALSYLDGSGFWIPWNFGHKSLLPKFYRNKREAVLSGVSISLILTTIGLNYSCRTPARELNNQTGESHLEQLIKNQEDSTVLLFEKLSELAPKKLYLSHVEINHLNGTLNLAGFSNDYKTTATFLSHLKKLPDFIETKRKKLNKKRIGRKSVVEFSLQCSTKPKDQYSSALLVFPPLIEEKISSLAKKHKINDLTEINLSEEDHRPTVGIQWNSGPVSSLAFISELEKTNMTGPIHYLTVAPLKSNSQFIHVKALFSFPLNTIKKMNSKKIAINWKRNIFRSLWEAPKVRTVKKSRAKSNAVKKRIQEKRDLEIREREKKRKLELIKRDLKSNLSLTGIVFNGNEPMAFVQSKNRDRQSHILKMGDTIHEAEVVLINERDGELKLDYQGQFEVSLHVNAPSARPAQ